MVTIQTLLEVGIEMDRGDLAAEHARIIILGAVSSTALSTVCTSKEEMVVCMQKNA